jgi:capsule polysaccharide export protein KpsC/LpsZ
VRTGDLLKEIDLLNGVSDGFIEVTNYKSKVVEILSLNMDTYTLIFDRNDATRQSIDRNNLIRFIEKFLTV